jgi:uncharacterized phage protein (TIGR02216 family)
MTFPWAEVMAAGLGLLRLAPRAFWAMTPRELAAALGNVAQPMNRETLSGLMKDYPDGE